MKRIIISLIISITFSICAFAESPTWNASFSKYVAWAKINGQVYTDIVVSIVSSQEDYTTNYTIIYRIGSSFVTYPWSKVTYPWVKIKIVDRETKKKIYSKKLMRSCLFIFEKGTHIQIGQPGNVTTEAIMDKKNDKWELVFDENGDL